MESVGDRKDSAFGRRILVVEDDANTRSFVRQGLEEEDYVVTLADSSAACFAAIKREEFDLIVLDIMLPDGDGLEICRKIRSENAQVPVLFLTAMGTSENIAMGLDTGADDYLVKPFKFIEFLARIRTLLRRTRMTPTKEASGQILAFHDITMDDYRKIVKRGNSPLNLTSTEFKMLQIFLKDPGKVISRTEILHEIWGSDVYIGSNVVDVYINYLRKKLENGGLPRIIHTVIGMGYVLKIQDED